MLSRLTRGQREILKSLPLPKSKVSLYFSKLWRYFFNYCTILTWLTASLQIKLSTHYQNRFCAGSSGHTWHWTTQIICSYIVTASTNTSSILQVGCLPVAWPTVSKQRRQIHCPILTGKFFQQLLGTASFCPYNFWYQNGMFTTKHWCVKKCHFCNREKVNSNVSERSEKLWMHFKADFRMCAKNWTSNRFFSYRS